jgi:hypothetical protein
MPDPADTALAFAHALEAADFGRLRALCGPGFTFVGLGPEPLDADTFVAIERDFHAAFAGVAYEPELVRTEGDTAVVRLLVSGRHTGPFLGREPTDAEFTLPPQDARYTVRDGVVVRAELPPTPGAGIDGILAQLGD